MPEMKDPYPRSKKKDPYAMATIGIRCICFRKKVSDANKYCYEFTKINEINTVTS
jgi:hypothetical protein